MGNWKLLHTKWDKLRSKYVVVFYDVKYGFTGKRMNDRRSAKTITINYDSSKYNPRYFGERSGRSYTLAQLKKFGKVWKK